MSETNLSNINIAIIGLGYVGLPLALEFSKKYNVVGFDINVSRINELKNGHDSTNETDINELLSANIIFSSQVKDIQEATCYIVTVPTPIDINKNPNLKPLISASELVGSVLKVDDLVIYESTVYPGATEEVCVPVLEKKSSLEYNKSFFVGYSPERINPGDKEHRLKDITKVTSGSDLKTAALVDSLYRTIIVAGTHLASSIKVAEAAKVIENTQRDLNIALINELAIIFNKLDINTSEVLAAAGTKWNFLPFKPGLVGGHCIGVDPYYLTHKAQAIGYEPEVILAGRKLNDSMAKFIASQAFDYLAKKKITAKCAKILVMGLAFKENCPDIRNTKVTDVISSLETYGASVDVYDPWVNQELAKTEYNIEILNDIQDHTYDLIIVAVGHDQFQELGLKKISQYGKKDHGIYDLKNLFPSDQVDMQL